MSPGLLAGAILGLGLALAFAAIVVRPKLGMYAWVALLGVELDFTRELIGAYLSPGDIVLIPTALGVFILLATGRQRLLRLPVTPYLWLLVGVFTVSLMRAAWEGAVTLFALANRYMGLIGFTIITLVGVTALGSGTREPVKLSKILVYSGSLLNIVCLGFYYAWFARGYQSPWVTPDGRLAGFLMDATAHGTYLAVVLLFQLSFLLGGHRLLPRLLDAANLLLLVIAIVLTFGRTAWISLFAGAAWLTFLYRHQLRKSFTIATLTAMPLLLIATTAFWLNNEHWLDLIWRTRTVEGRFAQITIGLELWQNSPLFGIGLGRFLDRGGGMLLEPNIIHNTFVWILVEAGIIGLVVFCGFVLQLLRSGRLLCVGEPEEEAVGKATMAALVATLTFMLGVEGLYQRDFWFLVILVQLLSLQRSSSLPRSHQDK